MGCYQSSQTNIQSIQDKMLKPKKFTCIVVRNKTIQIDNEEFCIGDYYTKDINEQDQLFNQKSFKKKFFFAFAKYHNVLQWNSKQSLINSLFELPDAENKLQKIILQVGLPQTFRWLIWKSFVQQSKDIDILNKRKKIYDDLVLVENKENELIVSKDIPRTAPGKKMFKNKNSIGSMYLQKVLKALGGFFPSINYVQGMNFLGATVLEISGIDDFQSWNLIIDLWLKETNLYYGVYDVNFPMMKFLCFAFHYILERMDYNLYKVLKKKQIQDEFWLVQWMLSFYTNVLPKNLLLLCLDFLMMTDCFGIVLIALSLCFCLKECFMILELEELLDIIKNKQKLQQKIDKKYFVEMLYSYSKLNLNKYQILQEYYTNIQQSQKQYFQRYYNILRYSLQQKEVPQKYKFKKYYDNLPRPAEIEFLKKSNYLQELQKNQKQIKLVDISNLEKINQKYLQQSIEVDEVNQILINI